MHRFKGWLRFFAVVGLAEGLLGLPNAAAGAPDQATKDRCASYAQRAVAQYQLMTSNPQCVVKDDLRWQSNLDNHYKGCLMLPEFLRKSEESARDDHLHACGGYADANAGAAPPAAAGNSASDTAAAPTAATPETTSNATALAPPPGASSDASSARPSKHAAPEPDKLACSQRAPAYYEAEHLTPGGVGAYPKLAGGVLTFTTSIKGKSVPFTYKVTIPAYRLAWYKCSGIKQIPLSEQYVWISDDGKQAKVFSVSPDQVIEMPASPAFARRLIRE